jgi:death-on-curing protein
MNDWVWIEPAVIFAVHDEQLTEHGGAPGLRDLGLLESALARPRNLVLYGTPDCAELAAAYALGLLTKKLTFIDGNKRTAFVALELFLLLNGQELIADHGECVVTMLNLSAGNMESAALAAWIRSHTRSVDRA